MATPAPWRCGYCLRTAGKVKRCGLSPVCNGCRDRLAGLGKKFCRECGKARPFEAFDRMGQGERRRAVCKHCRHETTRVAKARWMRTYRARHRAAHLAYRKAYRARNPERVVSWRRVAYLNQKMRASERLRAR